MGRCPAKQEDALRSFPPPNRRSNWIVPRTPASEHFAVTGEELLADDQTPAAVSYEQKQTIKRHLQDERDAGAAEGTKSLT